MPNVGPKKKALLVGINAYPTSPLGGCVNDVRAMAEYLQVHEGFAPKQIQILTDGRATRSGIVAALKALVSGVSQGDVVFFHYSGHGVQMPTRDASGEVDGLDECICPVDFDWTDATTLRDNDLAAIFSKLPAGVRFTWVSDSCHSADLQREMMKPTNATSPAERAIPRRMLPPEDVAFAVQTARETSVRTLHAPGLLLSGCRSDQTSSDAPLGPHGERYGALTFFLLDELRKDSLTPMAEVVRRVGAALRSYGFSQEPQLEGDEAAKRRAFLDTGTRDILEGSEFANAVEKSGAVELARGFNKALLKDIPGDLTGSGYLIDQPGAKIRYDVEPTSNDKITLVLRISGGITWWKSLEVFIDVNGQWVSGGRRIEVRDNQKEAQIDVYWWEPTTGMRLEFWKAGFLNFGAHVLSRHLQRDSNRGKRLIFTWERD